jgi:DNA-binding FrmR family transcriptional regulator
VRHKAEVPDGVEALQSRDLQAVGKHYLDRASKKALTNRLARLEGHIRSISRMVQDERCADEILLQAAAAKAAISQFSAVLLEKELRACMTTCMDGNADDRLDKVARVLATLLKQA